MASLVAEFEQPVHEYTHQSRHGLLRVGSSVQDVLQPDHTTLLFLVIEEKGNDLVIISEWNLHKGRNRVSWVCKSNELVCDCLTILLTSL